MASSKTTTSFIPAAGFASPLVEKDDETLQRHSHVVDTAKLRRLNVRPLPNGKWRVFDQFGAVITAEEFDQFEDAVEAAETALSQADAMRAETETARYLTALRAAKYIPWPTIRLDNGQIEWVVLTVPDRQMVGDSYSGLESALKYIAELVGI